MGSTLIHILEQEVKFSETDPLSIVWHGNYIRYFEDGREAFGKQYNMTYMTVFNNGYTIPIVNVQCNYKRPLKYGDIMQVETVFIPTEAAKITFQYTIRNAATQEVVATGSTVQVFLDKEQSILQLNTPPFFEEWKKKHHLI